MTLREFLKENKDALDIYIKERVGYSYKITAKERELWVKNDEPLYRYARSCGVKI